MYPSTHRFNAGAYRRSRSFHFDGECERRSRRNQNRTFAVRRKAANRTLPWDLAAGELDLVSSPPPQTEVIPARKKRRLEESFSASTASTDEGAAKTASPEVSVDLPAAADNANTRATGHLTPDEDAKLPRAVANTSKMKWGKEYKTDWAAVAALVPSRTKKQCWNRWFRFLDPSIDRANVRTGKWAEDEDIKLKDAVQTHGYDDWVAVASLVPDRTKKQCNERWKNTLDPSIARTAGRTGKWSKYENIKLKDAVQTHGGKNWDEIAALVPGRTRMQCHSRWQNTLDPSIDRASGCSDT
jgi:hypothetical protein